MSKSTKIVVSLLVIAGFVCLAIGTIFACDYISQSINAVALDKKQVIVASAERFALPNVRIDELMLDIDLPIGGFAPGFYTFDLSVVVPYNSFYFNKTLKFALESNVSSYCWFTLVSTNLPELDSFTGSLSFEVNFTSSNIVNLHIEDYDSVIVLDLPLDGTFDYFIEVQALDSFTVSDSDNYRVDPVPFPSEFFTSVAPGVLFVRELLGILVSGLTGIGQGLGESLSPIATAIFVNTAGDGLSVFGILIAVFAAISLGLTFTRWVLNFITSWSNRNR